MAAGFGTQANALLRKSAVYQKRNVCTNICLLSSPIFFCIILLIIKVLVNQLLLMQNDLKCGCMCKSGRCCIPGTKNCTNDTFCGDNGGRYKCQEFNKDVCGLQYSNVAQAKWCEIKEPSIWSPMLTVPRAKNRAAPNGPKGAITTLITAPNQSPSASASQLIPYIYRKPPYMDNTTISFQDLIAVNGTMNAHLLYQYGFTLATDADPNDSLYLESAFLDGTLYLVVPYSSTYNCSSLASVFSQEADNNTTTTGNINSVPFIDMLASMVNLTSNTNVSVDELRRRLPIDSPLTNSAINRPISCLNAIFSDQPDDKSLNRVAYCGFRQARCNGSSVTNQYPLSYEFNNASSDKLSLTLYFNGTGQPDNGVPPPALRLNLGLSALVTSWLTTALGGDTVPAKAVRLLGTMAMPKLASRLKLDLSTLLGPLFYTWVVQMLLPTFLQLLVYEKEKRLRMMMKMHGLGDGAYWLVTYLWYLLLYIVYMIIFIAFGAIVGLDVFRRTNIGVQIIFYFLFGNNMIAMSFLLSSFFSASRTSTVVAFLYVFATGLIGELLLKIFMESDESWVFFVEWIPAFALYRGLWEMSQYSFLGVYQGNTGLTFERLSDPGCGMRATWGIFVVEWAILMVLGWYCEQVLSSGTGIRRHPLYFLQCLFPKKRTPVHLGTPRPSIELAGNGTAANGGPGGAKKSIGSPGPGSGSVKLSPDEREDVRAERLRVEGLGQEEARALPIVVRDLKQVYPALDGGKPKVAVRTLTMAVERGECFGLLGPNGAGKSTSINMLTGFLEPTSGTALIEGLDITTQMSQIYSLMGVCPQHDLLWEQLTGEEHLIFYGRLKGLTGSDLMSAVTVALKSVNLFNGGVGQKQARKYSGGMKRRLSVAISFIGKPQVVYLDEPSTGLDPASRRALWDVVRANKAGRAIILTTHSMEEAEILCDRLGIFVDGQLVCIGNPREITSRYAGYLVFTITVVPGHEDAARAFVMHMSPNARLTYALGGTFKYELPTTDVSLSAVFDAMAAAKAQMAVLDWGVANATLEEVFIKFARQIGLETKDS